MNNQLIEKVIKTNGEPCPEFSYRNPLLDKTVARALSKSFVKILNVSEQNSKINNNLRLSILENIRKMCRIEPDNHVLVDDDLMESLTELYQRHTIDASSTSLDSVDKQLDAFLVRRFKNMDISSSYQSTLNPEIIQALINLNNNGVYLDMLSKDIVHWHLRNGNYTCILRDLWDYKLTEKFNSNMFDDIALKMKPGIEKLLLNICFEILTKRDIVIESIFTPDTPLMELIGRCSSPICFQICSGILNFLFIMTNFDVQLQKFIPMFIRQVKSSLSESNAIMLYPLHLNHLVVLLDFDINVLPNPLRDQYVCPTLNYLQKLHEESENDLILLLSHYPQWFDLYFSQPGQT